MKPKLTPTPTRMRHRFLKLTALLALPALLLTGCAADPAAQEANAAEEESSGAISVVTTFTLLEDMVRAIGGDNVEVSNLVPTGTDPHEYEPLPDDTKAASEAEVLFYNGLNLEGGAEGWFQRLVDSVGQPAENIIEVSQGVEPLTIDTQDGVDGNGGVTTQINPHAFIDPSVGVIMAQNIRDGLKNADPDHATNYDERAEDYIAVLDGIETKYADAFALIPEEKRVLVTSERAFQYLAASYALEEYFIWEIDTEENGSAQQLKTLIESLKGTRASHLLVESNVDTRPMETVSEATGIPLYERPVYSDEIGDQNDLVANTYLKYLEYNLDVITSALK